MPARSLVRKPRVRVFPADRVRGSPLAVVTLIGYGDYANPDCAKTYRTVQKIQKRLGSRLCYVFRCFPEPSRFGESEEAAEAAECASAQGKFWEMHDHLFEHSCTTSEIALARCARDVGLDLPGFHRSMRAHTYLEKVRANRRAGARHGVAGAPTFFINAKRHESAFGLSTLLPAVQAAAAGS